MSAKGRGSGARSGWQQNQPWTAGPVHTSLSGTDTGGEGAARVTFSANYPQQRAHNSWPALVLATKWWVCTKKTEKEIIM